MAKKRLPNNAPTKSRSFKGAEELVEEFHGRPPRGVKDVTKKIFYNKNIAQLADLEALEILDTEDPNQVIELDFTGEGLVLACTVDKKQLLITGDVEVTADDVPNPSEIEWTKPKVLLGECLAVCYYTDKHHLEGPKSQANGEHYRHEFGEMSGIRPMLVYDRVTKTLEFLGGDYDVRDVGITG